MIDLKNGKKIIRRWTIDPCFLTSLSHMEKGTNASFLLTKVDSMKLAVDMEGYLWNEYHRIVEDGGGVGLMGVIKDWLTFLKSQMNKENEENGEQIEKIKPINTFDFLKEHNEKIEKHFKEITKRCIAVSCLSKDKLLLTEDVQSIKKSNITKEFKIQVLDRKGAEDKLSSYTKSLKSPKDIQDALIKFYLPEYIKRKIEERGTGNIYYVKRKTEDGFKEDGFKDILKSKKNIFSVCHGGAEYIYILQDEEKIGQNIFEDLNGWISKYALICCRESKVSNGARDAIIIGGGHRVIIELKCAHKDDLEHGLVKQLPRYLKDEGAEYGIYLVLFFSFAYGRSITDKKFLEDKKRELEKIKEEKVDSSKYKIEIFWIDCSEAKPPSKE